MKLENLREDYYTLSGKASDVVRQLALAGIATAWIFSETASQTRLVPEPLKLPLCLLVAALGLDLLQYASASAIWGIYGRIQEKKGIKATAEFQAPDCLNWPALTCFWGKIALTIGAYVFLLRFLGAEVL